MILGTAGHIDHGKTALVHALTGVDTDRLPEEKRRGITIELGFAPLVLDGIGTVGVVDVPGHEAFVRTMLAGATGIDLALLVVAADEGVMPQTREHLAIVSLLGIRAGVVALTKCDLVDDDWIALVEDDVRNLLITTPLEGAAIVRVSALTGSGLDQLRAALAAAAAAASAAPPATDLFRMPVDRVFTLRGTGTVVTGTVWSGELRKGAAWIYPPGRSVRVRDLQSHGAGVPSVRRATRAAVALGDITVDEIERGAVLVSDPDWVPTDTVRASVQLLDDEIALTPRTRVRFHIGSADVGARLVSVGNPEFRIHLDQPLLCRGADRFVLRGGSPLRTIGGGRIIDPYSKRRARALAPVGSDAADVLVALCREAGEQGIPLVDLPVRLGVSPGRAPAVISDATLVATAERVYTREIADNARAALVALVAASHRSDPLAIGIPLEAARAKLGVPSDLFAFIVGALAAAGLVAADGAVIHAPGWKPSLDAAQSQLAEKIMTDFSAADPTIPITSITTHYGAESAAVVRHLEHMGRLVRLGDTLVSPAPVVNGIVDQLRKHMEPGRPYSPGQLREELGISRRILIPLLEYCDRVKVTERRGGDRVLREP